MRYLVATDGSDPGDRALAFALDLAGDTGASVTVVHAVTPSVRNRGGSGPVRDIDDAEGRLVTESLSDAEERGERILADAERIASDRGTDVRTETVYGDPERAIPEFADAEGYDLLFVGHRGLSENAERVLGSVAKTLVERSPVPVTVVR